MTGFISQLRKPACLSYALVIGAEIIEALWTQNMTAQAAVCNRHHSIDQQLRRWLLLSIDRLPSNELRVTQELIANMSGARRADVTQAALKLQDAGLINYSYGRIEVLDRTGLEKRVCECYHVVMHGDNQQVRPLNLCDHVGDRRSWVVPQFVRPLSKRCRCKRWCRRHATQKGTALAVYDAASPNHCERVVPGRAFQS